MFRIMVFVAFVASCIGVFAYLTFGPIHHTTSDKGTKTELMQPTTGDPLGIATLPQKVSAPPPLLREIEALNAHLTAEGILKYTNARRIADGIPQLTQDPLLSLAAQKKVDDMNKNQYFEHIAPDGTTIGNLIESTGYEFIKVGENLAKGNFNDDNTLVSAWMNSPGHKENILDQKYQNIGVAVGRVTFGGKKTWLAVQEFGMPLTACPSIDLTLKAEIDAGKLQYDSLASDIASLQTELDEFSKNPSVYNQKISLYNSKVNESNSLADLLKGKIALYNRQVSAVTLCIGN
jgi:uncharacterized protein YkwD